MEHFIGEIRIFPYVYRVPAGWTACDGRSLPCAGPYQPLFSVIGRRYGGDVATGTFKLPDFRQGIAMGIDPRAPANAVGQPAWDQSRRAGEPGGVPVAMVRHFICVTGTAAPVAFRAPFTLQGKDVRPTIDGSHTLAVQYGRAVIRDKYGSLTWQSGGDDGIALTLTKEGDLVLTDAAGEPVWQTDTEVAAGQDPILLFHPDGRLAIVDATGKEIWRNPDLTPQERKRGEERDRQGEDQTIRKAERALLEQSLPAAGQTVRKGEAFLPFGDGAYQLGLSDAGHATVKNRAGDVLWQSRVGGAAVLTFRADGELELRDGKDALLWNSGTAQPGSAAVLLQVTHEGEPILTRKPGKVRQTFWSGREAMASERERMEQGRLNAGRTLLPRQALRSPNGRFALELAAKGGMVIKAVADGAEIWTLDRKVEPIGNLAMQTDGNLVLYTGDGKAVWASQASWTERADHLLLTDEGELVLRKGSTLVWSSGNAPRPGRLVPGGRLAKGQSLRSPNGAIALTLRDDGILVLTDGAGKTLWTPDRSSPRSHGLVMQRDGNLVLEEEDHRVVWAAGTDDKSAHAPCHSLKVNDNGTITVSAPAGGKSWTSPVKASGA
ncbi:tail fiber protein [Azospirillum sp. B4]|uniref:tail fiber protein n=1 Tax=Azospirillum sp. B4 TaxID=95605 RepID=UPI0003491BCE|nr:tail fiber protein [Azospirillum sp. B4]